MNIVVIDGWEFRLTTFEEFKRDVDRFGMSLNEYHCVLDVYENLSLERPLTDDEQKEKKAIIDYYEDYLFECAENSIDELEFSLSQYK